MKHLRNWILLSLVIGTCLGLALRYADPYQALIPERLGWLCAALLVLAVGLWISRRSERNFYVLWTVWGSLLAFPWGPIIFISWSPLPSIWYRAWVFFRISFEYSLLAIGVISLVAWVPYYACTKVYEESREANRHCHNARLPDVVDPAQFPPPTKTPHH
jgi:hypothetical protein